MQTRSDQLRNASVEAHRFAPESPRRCLLSPPRPNHSERPSQTRHKPRLQRPRRRWMSKTSAFDEPLLENPKGYNVENGHRCGWTMAVSVYAVPNYAAGTKI